MGAKVELIIGPAGSGKTQRLLVEYRAALAAGPVGCALWLAPARRNIERLRQELLGPELEACFSPQCYTFGQFAIHVLSAAATPLRALNRLGQREILRELTAEAQRTGQLEHFSPIVDTPGFLDLLTSFVRELKRHEIWPEHLAERVHAIAGRRRAEPKLLELVRLYEKYQDVLNRQKLFDPEGRFWAARQLLRDGQSRPFARVRQVFVDGFTDFTRTEHEILEILAERVERVVISLPLEGEPRRGELFAKTVSTATELRRRHEIETTLLDRPRTPILSALGFIEANLFRSLASGPPAPAPRLDGVELIVAASARAEIESIAARVKRLLVTGDHRPASDRVATNIGASAATTPDQGVPCREILVVFRSLDAAEELVREVFHEYGVPLAMESGRPLARCGVLSAITALLRLEFDDWNQRELLTVLASSYLRPNWTAASSVEAVRAALALARRLQVSRGRQELLSRATRWSNRLERGTSADAGAEEHATPEHDAAVEENKAIERNRRQATLGLRFLEQLAAAVMALPLRASAAGWADAIERLAEQTGVAWLQNAPGSKSGARTADDDPIDALAFGAALKALRDAERLSGWLDQPARPLDRAQFWTLWQDLLRIEPLPDNNDETGRVRVLSAPAARGLSADYVFLAGLGEQSFPLAGGARSLLSDAEAAALVAAGLPLPAREDRGRDEMLLFYEAITRPRRGLFLSYAALDAKAQPLMPSPYLYELAELFGERWPKSGGALHLSPLPEYSEPLCLRDLRLMAVDRAGQRADQRDVSLLVELLRQPEAEAVATPGYSARAPMAPPVPLDVPLDSPPLLDLRPTLPVLEIVGDSGTGIASGARTDVGHEIVHPANQHHPEIHPAIQPGKESGGHISGLANNISHGLLMHEERRRAGFGAFEGLLLSDAAQASLAARFGPESLWSASQLEQYAACPFEFFLRRILRIEPLEDMALTVNYQQRGRVLHGVLAGLHRRVNERAGGPAPLGDAEAVLADARELLQELCSPRIDESAFDIALREIDRRLLTTAIERYVEQHGKYSASMAKAADGLLPAHFEVAFGAKAKAAGAGGEAGDADGSERFDPLSTSAPFRFDCGDETVLLQGRIDRIDIAAVGDSLVFNVLDYKSGKSDRHGRNAVAEGLALQLPLYAVAAAELLLADKQAAPLQAGYWFLKGAGYAPALKCHDASSGQIQSTDDWLAYRKQLGQWVLAAVRGVGAGYFPVYSRDEDCTGRCPYNTVCRINQVRTLHKVWTPPEMAGPSAAGSQQSPDPDSPARGSSAQSASAKSSAEEASSAKESQP